MAGKNKTALNESQWPFVQLGEELEPRFSSFMESSAKSGENVRDAFNMIGIGLFFEQAKN